MSDNQAFGPSVPSKPSYVHTLSLRLTANDYRRLRRFVMAREDALGSRLTHQSVLETALGQFLERNQAPEPG